MRDELLEDNMFEDLNHARTLIGAWSHRYNEGRCQWVVAMSSLNASVGVR